MFDYSLILQPFATKLEASYIGRSRASICFNKNTKWQKVGRLILLACIPYSHCFPYCALKPFIKVGKIIFYYFFFSYYVFLIRWSRLHFTDRMKQIPLHWWTTCGRFLTKNQFWWRSCFFIEFSFIFITTQFSLKFKPKIIASVSEPL